jgi:hypothetical protein
MVDLKKLSQIQQLSEQVRKHRRKLVDHVVNKDRTSIWLCPVCWTYRLCGLVVVVLLTQYFWN